MADSPIMIVLFGAEVIGRRGLVVLCQFRSETLKFSRPDSEFRDLLFLRLSHACPPKTLGIAGLHPMGHALLDLPTAFIPSDFCECGASNFGLRV